MKSLVQGVHHITLCPGGAQEDMDFFTQVLGQRLVKQTVLMDGNIPIYHLYYGNADADVGSIATVFPYTRKPGRAGSGQLSCTSYTVPNGAIGVLEGALRSRTGPNTAACRNDSARSTCACAIRPGCSFEMIEEASDQRNPWTTTQISRDVGTRGFFGAVLSVRDVREQESFFVDALGFRKVGVDGPVPSIRNAGNRSPDASSTCTTSRSAAPGSWGFGAGTAHHIAFNVETDEALVKQKAIYEELGLHRRVRGQGSLLLPLHVRALARRHPRRVHGERPWWVLSGRSAGGARHDAAPAAVVRGAAGRDRLAARADHGSGREPAEIRRDVEDGGAPTRGRRRAEIRSGAGDSGVTDQGGFRTPKQPTSVDGRLTDPVRVK